MFIYFEKKIKVLWGVEVGLKEVGKRNFGKGSNSPCWEGEFAEAGEQQIFKEKWGFWEKRWNEIFGIEKLVFGEGEEAL